MKPKFSFLLSLVAVASFSVQTFSQNAKPLNIPPEPLAAEVKASSQLSPSLEKWRQIRFGMFIHWGLYAIPAKGEWAVFSQQMDYEEYKKLSTQFTADKFNAKEWAAAAKDAGMGYMVLTSRHHDGFALWDSPSSYEQFTSMKSAAKKDFVAEYTDACRDAGLMVGLYYSPLDWRFPGFFFPKMYRKNAEEMRDQTYGQVRELLSNYGKIDILWYDGGGDNWLGLGGLQYAFGKQWHVRPEGKNYDGKPLWEPEKLQAMVRSLQQGIITNPRSGAPGDFESREFKVGEFNNKIPWEKCATINGVWGYKDVPARPLSNILGELTNTVCRDGNFLLNVGPRADGTIAPDQLVRLHEIGEWMKVNGEAIYGTRGGPLLPTDYCGTTYAKKYVYVHIWKWPTDAKITLDKLPSKVVSASTLSGDKVMFKTNDQGLVELIQTKVSYNEPLTIIKLIMKVPLSPSN
jgi:alpha-L-fucosidase